VNDTDQSNNLLWIFNYDGTLCDSTVDRKAACLEISCEAMLMSLAEIPFYRVAVLSSRSLDDLASRIAIPRLYLGGGNGTEWLIPGQGRKRVDALDAELTSKREKLLPQIGILKRYPGVEIEDKKWSISIRTHNASELMKKEIDLVLYDLMFFRQYKKYRAPDEVEILILPSADKASGIRNLCGFLNYEPESGELIYVGDHENDIPAMQWVRFLRGEVFTVGRTPLVLGSRLVASPAELSEKIISFANARLRRSSLNLKFRGDKRATEIEDNT